jgi:hypothetical protein
MISIEELALPEVPVVEGVATFCVAHRPPYFRLPEWITLIDTSGFSIDHNPFQVRHFLVAAGLSPLDPSYLANESLLLIEALVRRQRQAIDRVCLLIHRKFVTAQTLGVPATNFDHMRLVNSHEVVLSPELLFGDQRILTSQPIDMATGVLYQYAYHHSLLDFLQLSELAVQSGGLDRESYFDFCQGKLMIAGALLGVTPVDLFLHCLEKARSLMLLLYEVRFTSVLWEDPYQARAGSFFLERLLSFHLLHGLHEAGVIHLLPGAGAWPQQMEAFGWLVTAQDEPDPDGTYQVGIR